MGRAREFDIDKALEIATDLFWRKGYDGASISDMTSAMGIKPPSFYAAFGSKEGLFQRIVDAYQASQKSIIDGALSQPTIGDVVKSFLYGYADFLTERGRAPGCLLLNSSLPIVEGHPFRKQFADSRNAITARLRTRFKSILQSGEDDSGINADILAQLVTTVLWGLAVEAQSGASRASLRATVTEFCACRWPETRGA